ncbi:MAG: hypothetical protein KDC02_14610 [Flavobacteriales bacterium]|nr:hypothetical protein [Flavobacteriales bacterium]
MLRIPTCLAFLVLSCSVAAQADVLPAGGEASGPGGTVSCSVGQVAAGAYTGPGGTVQEGVQQPYVDLSTSTPEGGPLQARLWPNPANEFLQLELTALPGPDLEYQLFDEAGRQLLSGPVNGPRTTLPIDRLATGAHLMVLLEHGTVVGSIPFIKEP